MTNQFIPTNTRPDPGEPPPAVAAGFAKLYNRPKPLEDDSLEWLEDEPHGSEHEASARRERTANQEGKTVVLPDASLAMDPSDLKLMKRLRNSDSSLTIRVNGVELTLDVVDVLRNELSICCLVRINGMRCRIPRSESVEIELEGKVFRTAFLGSWHTVEWLGVHVVVFPILPEEPIERINGG